LLAFPGGVLGCFDFVARVAKRLHIRKLVSAALVQRRNVIGVP
jgi:hypothetical protein